MEIVETIMLSREDQSVLVEALLNPPELSPALRGAMIRYAQLIVESFARESQRSCLGGGGGLWSVVS
ncbi:DUF1778 domain-containing protein [Burkholderia sp. BKH01]|uniref:type II toxin -antitoxin system TacA 1-like antitoxin n=1 Tax=Burkholderia sp. BKH01 TaxID=2769262 RepID=UPI00398BC54F